MKAVRVSRHAYDRARERFPDVFPANTREASGIIAREVKDALANGRSAKRQPRWSMRARDRERPKANRYMRFCWTDDRARVYVIERRTIIEVVTVMHGLRT